MDLENIITSLNFTTIGWQIIAPILFMLFDILTGFIQAVINKNVDSSIMRKGLLHKVLLIIVMTASFILDFTFHLPVISIVICIYIIIMEIVSILENLEKAGFNVGKLKEIFKGKEENKWNLQNKN